jgi:hypothetical protein
VAVEAVDYNANLPRNGQYELNPSPDSAHYTLQSVEDSPIPGHQVQVYNGEQE